MAVRTKKISLKSAHWMQRTGWNKFVTHVVCCLWYWRAVLSCCAVVFGFVFWCFEMFLCVLLCFRMFWCGLVWFWCVLVCWCVFGVFLVFWSVSGILGFGVWCFSIVLCCVKLHCVLLYCATGLWCAVLCWCVSCWCFGLLFVFVHCFGSFVFLVSALRGLPRA